MRTILSAACYVSALLAAVSVWVSYTAALLDGFGVFGVMIALMTVPLALVYPLYSWIDTGHVPMHLFLLLGLAFGGSIAGAVIAPRYRDET